MRGTLLTFTAVLVFLIPLAVRAEMDHAMHRGNVVHEEVVDGVKATFSITAIAKELKAKATHHLAAEFKDARSGKGVAKGLVAVRLQGPGQGAEPRELVAMDGHFGSDLDLARPGKYGIMCRFVFDDGKKRQALFWYEVK